MLVTGGFILTIIIKVGKNRERQTDRERETERQTERDRQRESFQKMIK
jgi:hypothetical protein